MEYLTAVARRLIMTDCGAGACPPPISSSETAVRITVLEDPTVGAFAMPGGRLFIHTGLLSVVETEAQLAMVLARELAHDSSTLPATPRKGPAPRGPLSPTAAAILGLDLTLATNAAIEGYRPESERRADAEALRRLVANGYDARQAAGVFARLAGDDPDRRGLAEIFYYGRRPRMRERDTSVRELRGRPDLSPVARGDDVAFARVMLTVVRDNAGLDVRAGRFALAQRQLDRVLALSPNDSVAQLHYGDLYRLRSQGASGSARDEDVGKALASYERVIELDPGAADPFRQLALLHFQRRDTVKARAAFERYLVLAPGAADAPRIREYLAVLQRRSASP